MVWGAMSLSLLRIYPRRWGFLLTLTAMERVSEVVSHDFKYRLFHPEGVTFALPDLTNKSWTLRNPTSFYYHTYATSPFQVLPSVGG